MEVPAAGLPAMSIILGTSSKRIHLNIRRFVSPSDSYLDGASEQFYTNPPSLMTLRSMGDTPSSSTLDLNDLSICPVQAARYC